MKVEHHQASTLQSKSSNSKAISIFMNRPSGKLAGLGILAAVTLASRIPFASKVLYHWDSVNFAYALSEFNLAKEQPQPPGYILYVWLCRALNWLVHDPQTVMVAVGIAAGVGAVMAMFFLGEAMYTARTGWIGAAFLATSPLFWFYNEIALPHSLDAFLVILGALFMYKTMKGEHRYLIPSVLVLAVAGGVRQQTLVFLAPVFLYSIRRVGWKKFIVAGVVGAAACLAWFIPLISLSGGLNSYLQVMGNFTDRFQKTTSIFEGAGLFGLKRNAIKLILYFVYGCGIVLLPTAYAVVHPFFHGTRRRLDERAVFIGLWILPAFMYYLLVHMGQQGLVFVFLPAWIILGAAGMEMFASTSGRLALTGALLLVLLNGAIFLTLPEYPFGSTGQRLLTRQTIANSDRYYLERFQAIRANFPPASTLIVASNWHHVQYYLPEYRVLPFTIGSKWELDEGAPVAVTAQAGTPAHFGLSSARNSVLIFDPALIEYASTPQLIRRLALSSKSEMGVMEFSGSAEFTLSGQSFGMEEK